MHRRERGWVVVDVVMDGLSLASSYRAQVQRVMQSRTYADVVARLRDKASTSTLAAIAAAKRAGAAAPPTVAPPLAPVAPPPREIAAGPVLVASAALVFDAPPTPAPPRAPEDAAPRATSMSPARKWFWIQVGAFRDTDAASRLVERLHDRGVMVATGGGSLAPLARVLVGPFANRAAAASVLKELAARGYRAFIALE